MKTGRESRINLLAYRQEEIDQQRRAQRKVLIVAVATVLLVVAAASWWWTQNRQVRALEEENQRLREQVEDMSRIAAVAGGVSDMEMKELGSRKALLDRLEEERTIDPQQLEEIYALSIPDITIGKMNVKDGGEITIDAYTNSRSDLIGFVEELQNQKFVREIQRISSKRNDKTGEISFTLILAGEVASK